MRLGLGLGQGTGGGIAGPAGDAFIASNGATHPNFPGVIQPGLYHAGTNRTWYVWEAWATLPATDRREVRCTIYDHTAGRWLPETVIGSTGLTNDAHGSPAIVIMDDGHAYVFFGAHGLAGMKIYRTNVAGSHWGWTQLTTLGTALTYSKPLNISGVMHFVARANLEGGDNYPLIHYNTTSITAGVPAWTAMHRLVDLGTDTRCYFYRPIVRAGKIHIVGHRANAADTLRQDLFYLIYDPAANTIANMAGTASIDVSVTPANRTQMETDFRLFTSPGVSWTSNSDFVLDSSGFPHVVFGAGNDDSLNLRYMRWNGSAWTSPVEFAAAPRGNFNVSAIIETSADNFEVWYVDDTDNSPPGSSGKSIRRKKFNAAGTFQSEEIMYTWDGSQRIGFPFAVRNGHANAKLTFVEAVVSDNDSGAGGLKCFMHGANGLLRRVRGAYTYESTLASQYFARLIGPYSYDEKYYIDQVFKLIETIGVSKFDAIWDRGTNDRADAAINLLSSSYQSTEVGGVSWAAKVGYTLDGSTGYVDTNYIPSVNGVAWTATSASYGAFQLNASLNANAFYGISDGTQRAYMLLDATPNFNIRINDNTATQAAVANKVGLFSANRNGTTKLSVRSGVQVATATVSNTGRPTQSVKLGRPIAGTFADATIGFDWVGGSLTLAEMQDLYFIGVRPLAQLRGLI